MKPRLGSTRQLGNSKELLPRHHFHDPPPDGRPSESNYANRSRPYHDSRNCQRCHVLTPRRLQAVPITAGASANQEARGRRLHLVSGVESGGSGTHKNEIDGACPCCVPLAINAAPAALLHSAAEGQLPALVTAGDDPPGTSTIR